MTGYAAFIPDRPAAVAVIRRVWGEMRQWRAHFESFGVSGRLIDTLTSGIRDLDDIAGPALRARYAGLERLRGRLDSLTDSSLY